MATVVLWCNPVSPDDAHVSCKFSVVIPSKDKYGFDVGIRLTH